MSFSRSVSASAAMTPSSSSNSNSTIIPPNYNPNGSRYQNQNYNSRGDGLRVNTDQASRLRSNSALSPRPSPNMYNSTNGNGNGNASESGSQPYHSSSSRSLSTSHLKFTPSPQSHSPNDHVALAVKGLRGDSPPPLLQDQRFSPATASAFACNAPAPTSAVSVSVPVSENEEDPTLKRLRDALEASSDDGDTLDLSRQDIRKISNEVVELLRSGVGKQNKGVWRLALSYNSLRNGSIADSFARLSRLRYLNLKGNYLTQFPIALADMVALEILDLSKNRITAFPDQPGRLVNLKVLSLTNNKMYTLPSYLVDFALLKVFKVDQNPIEWPPREVLGSLAVTEEKEKTIGSTGKKEKEKEEDLRPWIENMKSWMRQKSAESDRLLEQSLNRDKGYRSDEPPNSASSESSTSALPWHQQRNMPQLAMSSVQTIRPALQPLRNDSDSSLNQTRPQMSARAMSTPFNHDSPGRAASPISRINTSAARHERNPSALSCNSPLSASTISSAHSRATSNVIAPAQAQAPAPVTMQQGHSRGASYTATQRMSANLTAKKSLPDLRQSHAKIILERRNEGQGVEEARPLGLGIAAPTVSTFKLPGKGSWVPDMIRSPTGPSFSSLERGKILGRKGSVDMLRRTSGDAGGEMSEKRSSQEGPLMDESRNSYFRRLSTLPVSTISKAIPPALLKFIDSIRGILFALTQLHSALRQYLVFAVNERIASVFARVMEPASNYMNTLINALDRFDSISRRHTPPVHAIRGVLDAAKENVAVFAKVVAVLRLQVPTFKGNDVRYTRTLLLMIYGSMAEVACSWQNMAPLLSEIKPLIAPDIGGLAMRAVFGGQKMVPTGSLTGRTPISPIIERRESHSPPSATKTLSVGNSPLSQVVDQTPNPLPIPTSGPVTPSWAGGRSRRQAGSFSSQDVERGMLMGSPGGPRSAIGEQSMNGDAGQPSQPQLSYLCHRPSESATIVLENQEEEEESDVKGMAPPTLPAASSIATNRSSPKMTPTTPPEILAPSQQPVTMVSTTSQTSRRGLGHQPSSSSGSSHALSLMTNVQAQPQTYSGTNRKLSVDVRPPTPTSATLFDEDLLDVIETATEIAFTCWLKLAVDIGASTPPFSGSATTQSHAKSSSQGSVMSTRSIITQDSTNNSKRPLTISAKHHTELLHLLSVAEQITASLRESLMGLRANPLLYSNTTLPDDAQAFIKTVVKVSGLVKVISTNHTFPINVRQNLSRLTQATRECAILIQVSSLRPGNVTPAPVPPPSAAISVRSTSPYNRMDSRENSMEDLNSLPPSTASSNYNSNYSFSNHYNGNGNANGGYSNLNSNPPASAGWEYQQHSQPPPPQQREGLRGLQLPSRQMALGRSRSANVAPAPPTITMGSMGDRRDAQGQGQGQGQPRSAQPSQVAF